jgi:hypothetical protein
MTWSLTRMLKKVLIKTCQSCMNVCVLTLPDLDIARREVLILGMKYRIGWERMPSVIEGVGLSHDKHRTEGF